SSRTGGGGRGGVRGGSERNELSVPVPGGGAGGGKERLGLLPVPIPAGAGGGGGSVTAAGGPLGAGPAGPAPSGGGGGTGARDPAVRSPRSAKTPGHARKGVPGEDPGAPATAQLGSPSRPPPARGRGRGRSSRPPSACPRGSWW